MRTRLFALLVTLAAILVAPLAQAGAPEGALASTAARWVDADLTVAQPTLTVSRVTGTFDIYRYDLDGRLYDADDFGRTYRGLEQAGNLAGAEAFATQLETKVLEALAASLSTSFPGAEQSDLTAHVDRATLVAPSGDPYTPAVRVTVGATVTRSAQAAGLGTLSDAAIAAAFDAGARVATTFRLSSPDGHHTVYTVRAPSEPAGLVFDDLDEAPLAADGRSFTFTLDSQRTPAPPAVIEATVRDAAATPPKAEDIRTTIDVRLGQPDAARNMMPIVADVKAELRSVDVRERFPSLLPANVRLDFLSSDGMRALRTSGALGDDHVARANTAFLDTIRENLSRTLGSSVTTTGGLVGTDLSAPATPPYRADRPVHFLAKAEGGYALPAGAADKLGVGLDIGADVTFSLDLFGAPRQATSFVLHPVPGAKFTSAQGGALGASGASATYSVPAGAGAFPTTLAMRGADAPTLSAQEAELDIVVDLKDLDVTLGKALGGDLGSLVMDVTVTGNLGVIEVPESMKSALLPRTGRMSVDLDYLSSDAIRLLRARGLVSEANLSVLEDKLLADVEGKLAAALGADVTVVGGFDSGSLAGDLMARPLSGDKPIVFRATTSITKPLGGQPVQTGAIALYTQTQSFTLPKVQGLDTTYTIILPRGLAVTDLQATGGDFEMRKADDGRDSFRVTPTESTAQATVAMSVTPTFVLVKFWPVVLFAVLLLVLVIGTPVALLMRRRKK